MAGKRPASRLYQLGEAHAKYGERYTPRVEDYLEIIYELIKEKGYATTTDISHYLHVRAPTVTRMIQKLHGDELLIYEKYRGIKLRSKGERLAKSVRKKHGVLAEFLKLLGIDEDTAQRDAEGIEHHLHPETLDHLARFVSFVKDNPEWLKPLRERIAIPGA